MKEFKEFIKIGIVKKQSPNKSRAKDLLEESNRKYKSLKLILDRIGLSDENANDIIEYCYDILISLIRSKLYLEGFKSSNHEAEISYLAEIDFSETEVKIIDELRQFRNGIKYYGKKLNKDYAEKILNFLEKIQKRLKDLLKF